MKIELRKDKLHTFTIFVDEEVYSTLFSVKELAQIWYDEIQKLEIDINDLASQGKNLGCGEYFWAYTWDNHRNDGVSGTPYHYYMIAVLKILKKRFDFKIIQYDDSVPRELTKHIRKTLNVEVRCTSKKNDIKSVIKNSVTLKGLYWWLQILKNFGKTKLRNLKNDFENNDYTLISSNARGTRSRIDYYSNYLNFKNTMLYNSNLIGIINKTLNEKTLNPYILLSFTDFISTLKEAILVQKTLKHCLKNNESLLSKYVMGQGLFLFWVLSLKKALLFKSLKNNPPKQIIRNASVADPNHKLALLIAKKLNIPFYTVACRPTFNDYRPEDRVIEADLKEWNDVKLPKTFFVKDLFSKNTLTKRGIPERKIDIVQPERNEEELTNQEIFKIKNGIILLFTQYHLNTEMINLLKDIDLNSFDNIYIRSHPNKDSVDALGEIQKNLLNSLPKKIVNITDYKMNQLSIQNSIALGADTTAMVEIVRQGAGIVWLPFLSLNCLQHYPVMKILGYISESRADFLIFFENIIQVEGKRSDFIEKCKKSYHQFILK